MTFDTQDTTHKGIVHNQESNTKILYGLQKIYRSGVGLILYLVKHSWPELSNAVRVLESAEKCKENGKDELRNILRSACPYVRRNNLRILESRMIRAW